MKHFESITMFGLWFHSHWKWSQEHEEEEEKRVRNVQILTRFLGFRWASWKAAFVTTPHPTKYWLQDVWGGDCGAKRGGRGIQSVTGVRKTSARDAQGGEGGVGSGSGPPPPTTTTSCSSPGGSVNLLSGIKDRAESCGRLLGGGLEGGFLPKRPMKRSIMGFLSQVYLPFY